MSDPRSHNDPLHASQSQGHAQASDPAHSTGSSAHAGGQPTGAPPPESSEPLDPFAAAQAEVAILQAKVAELQNQFVRGQAEVQNARRRADEEVSKARKFALESFADSLLPVLDSLEAGLAIQSATPEQIREGAEATLRQLKSAMERNKIIAIDPAAGTKFDPAQHRGDCFAKRLSDCRACFATSTCDCLSP